MYIYPGIYKHSYENTEKNPDAPRLRLFFLWEVVKKSLSQQPYLNYSNINIHKNYGDVICLFFLSH